MFAKVAAATVFLASTKPQSTDGLKLTKRVRKTPSEFETLRALIKKKMEFIVYSHRDRTRAAHIETEIERFAMNHPDAYIANFNLKQFEPAESYLKGLPLKLALEASGVASTASTDGSVSSGPSTSTSNDKMTVLAKVEKKTNNESAKHDRHDERPTEEEREANISTPEDREAKIQARLERCSFIGFVFGFC